MTDLEITKRAKEYIDKMANGIDPITGEQIPTADALNNVRISRCLFFVSDILRQVIENGGVIGKKAKTTKQPFSVSHNELSGFAYSSTPIHVSEIAKRINALTDDQSMARLKPVSITSFLIDSGFLVQVDRGDGHNTKIPTEAGKNLGISIEERIGQNGEYHVTVYNKEAQQFIVDNFDAIAEINNRPRERAVEKTELQGQPWSITHDEMLVDLYQKNVPISEIAVTLKRTRSGITSRIKKLGLNEDNAAK